MANIGQLRALRETIKLRALSLSHAERRRVLERLEALQARRAGAPPRRLPEMTMDELYREIKWRTGTIGYDEARALVEYLDRRRA